MNLTPTEKLDQPTSDPDHKRVEALAYSFMGAIHENYTMGPMSRERVLESLNALAICAAIVLKGADGLEGKAKEFFDDALVRQFNLKEDL